MKTKEKVEQEQKSLINVNDFFKKIIIVGDNIKRSRYENGIIIMSIYDFLLDQESLSYQKKFKMDDGIKSIPLYAVFCI